MHVVGILLLESKPEQVETRTEVLIYELVLIKFGWIRSIPICLLEYVFGRIYEY